MHGWLPKHAIILLMSVTMKQEYKGKYKKGLGDSKPLSPMNTFGWG